MAEQFDKIIQNGITSFVPRSNKTRQFWMKQNAKVAGAQNASKETVTIMPATDEEVAEWLKDSAPTKSGFTVPAQVPISSPALEELQKQMVLQQEQIRQQQEMIQQLLTAQQSAPAEGEKERSKPGPKPKTDING